MLDDSANLMLNLPEDRPEGREHRGGALHPVRLSPGSKLARVVWLLSIIGLRSGKRTILAERRPLGGHLRSLASCNKGLHHGGPGQRQIAAVVAPAAHRQQPAVTPAISQGA